LNNSTPNTQRTMNKTDQFEFLLFWHSRWNQHSWKHWLEMPPINNHK